MKKLFLLILTVSFLNGGMSHAQTKNDPYYIGGEDKREDKLNFEGGIVEGMDKNRTSLGTVTNKEKVRGRRSLYRKLMSFEAEIDETLKDIGY